MPTNQITGVVTNNTGRQISSAYPTLTNMYTGKPSNMSPAAIAKRMANAIHPPKKPVGPSNLYKSRTTQRNRRRNKKTNRRRKA